GDILAELDAWGPSGLPTMLILGESGSGKEAAARLMHEAGLRRDRPFVVLNCASLPDGALETELFGSDGDATADERDGRSGLLGTSSQSTVVLDEISALPMRL